MKTTNGNERFYSLSLSVISLFQNKYLAWRKPKSPTCVPHLLFVHSRLSSFNLECKQFNLIHKWNVNYVALKPQHAILTHWSSKSIKSKHTQVKVNIRMWIELGWQSEELEGAKVLVDLITKMLRFYCNMDEYLDAMDNNLGWMSCLNLHLLPTFSFLSNQLLERQHHQEKKESNWKKSLRLKGRNIIKTSQHNKTPLT